MEQIANQLLLRGSLLSLPEFSHDHHGRRFFRFFLEVPRLSGTMDILPVIAGEPVVNALDPTAGAMLTVTGTLRSHNLQEGLRRRLLIFAYASRVTADDAEPCNDVTLEGTVCREPVYRRTPLGREICDIMLAVPRAFHRADYLPCILWGRLARQGADLHTRDRLRIQGRLQSRLYTKITDTGPQERTAYEVSALWAGPADPEG